MTPCAGLTSYLFTSDAGYIVFFQSKALTSGSRGYLWYRDRIFSGGRELMLVQCCQIAAGAFLHQSLKISLIDIKSPERRIVAEIT